MSLWKCRKCKCLNSQMYNVCANCGDTQQGRGGLFIFFLISGIGAAFVAWKYFMGV